MLFLTTKDLARRLNVSLNTARNYCERGYIQPAAKLRNMWVIAPTYMFTPEVIHRANGPLKKRRGRPQGAKNFIKKK